VRLERVATTARPPVTLAYSFRFFSFLRLIVILYIFSAGVAFILRRPLTIVLGGHLARSSLFCVLSRLPPGSSRFWPKTSFDVGLPPRHVSGRARVGARLVIMANARALAVHGTVGRIMFTPAWPASNRENRDLSLSRRSRLSMVPWRSWAVGNPVSRASARPCVPLEPAD